LILDVVCCCSINIEQHNIMNKGEVYERSVFNELE